MMRWRTRSKSEQRLLKQKTDWLPGRLSANHSFTLACCLMLVASNVAVSAQSVLPTGGSVAAGNALIGAVTGNNLTITQPGGNAIINWDSFSVGRPNAVDFQNGSGATLNRVTGLTVSQIDGSLTATGSLFLINENGLIVGPTGRIETGGRFVGSTRDIGNDDFLNGGANTFTGDSTGDIVVQGSITSLNDDVVLIARSVTNEGVLTAANGTVAMGAGSEVYLQDTSTADGLMYVRLASDDAGITHEGVIEAASAELRANGGNVYTFAGNRSGEVNATGSSTQDGRIFLTAEAGSVSVAATLDTTRGSDGGDIEIAGGFVALGAPVDASGARGGTVTVNAQTLSMAESITVTGTSEQGGSVTLNVATDTIANNTASIDVGGASGGSVRWTSGEDLITSADVSAIGTQGKGGQIDISGGAVRLFSPAIDASGTTGGGTVRLGGEYQGGKGLTQDELPNALALAATDATTVRADVTGADGDGGTIIFWADQRAAVLADITARPGTNSGAGGFVEISSGDDLQFGGTASTGRNGRNGTVLLDPKDIVIANEVDQSIFILGNGYGFAGFAVDRSATLNSNSNFGSAISLDGTRLAVGAPVNSTKYSTNPDKSGGAVHLFTFVDTDFSGGSLAATVGPGYAGAYNVSLSDAVVGDDKFGASVSLNGTQLAVGAPRDSGNGGPHRSGAVYLFAFADENFASGTLAATIGAGYSGDNNIDLSGTLDPNDFFGTSVSLDANRLAVGAPGDGGDGTGAVYLFGFTDAGFAGGSHVATLGTGYKGGNDINLLGTIGTSDGFGSSVSLDGARLAVGATGDDGFEDNFVGAGAAYLFSFSNDAFADGSLVATVGSGYVVGDNIDLSGSLDSYDKFGASVSLDGAHLAVGAPDDDGDSSTNSGAVYLFTFNDNTFAGGSLSATFGVGYNGDNDLDLKDTLDRSDRFGSSVSLSGTRLAVGAPGDDGSDNATTAVGAVYLFGFTDAGFVGGSLIASIGAGYMSTPEAPNNLDLSGSVDPSDNFGAAVSLDGTRLAVGVTGDDGSANGLSNSGAVLLFSFADTAFGGGSLAATIGAGYSGGNNIDLSSALESADGFGTSVSLDGTRLAVGSVSDDGAGNQFRSSGAVYLFTFTDDTFGGGSHVATLGTAYKGEKDINLLGTLDISDSFGSAVSLSGTQLAVGATGDDGSGNKVSGTGAVHLFTFADDTFSGGAHVGTIGWGYSSKSSTASINMSGLVENRDSFGSAVSLDGTNLAVGAIWDDGRGNGKASLDTGAVYLFTFADASFSGGGHVGTFGSAYNDVDDVNLADMLDSRDGFGTSVSLQGRQLAVGSPGDRGDKDMITATGAVYLFTFTDDALAGGEHVATIGAGYTGLNDIDLSGALSSSDEFGTSVSLDADRLAVGAPRDDGDSSGGNINTWGTGAVYLINNPFGGSSSSPVADAVFLTSPGDRITITTATLAALLNSGNEVELQANNDIFFMDELIANNPSGDGGAFTAKAGRSILVNADIATDNGSLVLEANSSAAASGNRDAGAGNIILADGVGINVGTGDVTLEIQSSAGGAWLAGDILFTGNNTITAEEVSILNKGEDTLTHAVTLGTDSQFNLSGGEAALAVTTSVFTNNAGANVFIFSDEGGRFRILSNDWDADTRGGLTGGNRYNADEIGSGPSVRSAGNLFFYQRQPTLTLTADDATRVYGLDNPDFSFTAVGLVNGDTQAEALGIRTANSSVAATAASNVADYLLTMGLTGGGPGGHGGRNDLGYAFTTVNGTLSVTPASLTVTADDAAREYGLENPTLTSTITGFRNSDTEGNALIGSASLTTVAMSASDVGTYDIATSASSLAANNGNYIFSLVNGQLSVTPATLTVTADDADKNEGEVNPFFTATATGFRNGDDQSRLAGLGFFSDSVTASPEGSYFIRPIGGEARNYTLTRVDGVLTVAAAPGSEISVEDAGIIRLVETQSGDTSLASVFTSGTFNSPIFGGLGSEGTTSGAGTGTGTGADTGGVVIEIVLADGGPGSGGAFGFQLPLNFSGCSDEGACSAVPDSVFNSSFVAVN